MPNKPKHDAKGRFSRVELAHKTLQANGYVAVNTGAPIYQHPETGHTITLSDKGFFHARSRMSRRYDNRLAPTSYDKLIEHIKSSGQDSALLGNHGHKSGGHAGHGR